MKPNTGCDSDVVESSAGLPNHEPGTGAATFVEVGRPAVDAQHVYAGGG